MMYNLNFLMLIQVEGLGIVFGFNTWPGLKKIVKSDTLEAIINTVT